MRVRVRWWWFVLAFVAILIVSVPVGLSLLREHNLAAYEADGKVLADLGYVVSWDEVEFPPMDADVQARWRAWVKGVQSVQGPLEPWWNKPRQPIPEGASELLSDRRRDLAIGLECLRSGRMAPMSAELATIHQNPDPASAIQTHNLFALREIASFHQAEAIISLDPSEALAGMDRVDASLNQPLLVIDLMIAAAIAEKRDDAWLQAVRSRRVTRDQARAWLEEDGDWLVRCRLAWMGERLWSSLLMEVADESADPFVPTSWYWSAIGPAEANHQRHSLATMEAILGSLSSPPPMRGIIPHTPLLSSIAIPNLKESLHTIADRATTGRIKRFAARISLDHQDGKPWPIDEAELLNRYGSDILNATDTSSALTYRLGRDGVPLLTSHPGKPPAILPPPHRTTSLALTEP